MSPRWITLPQRVWIERLRHCLRIDWIKVVEALPKPHRELSSLFLAESGDCLLEGPAGRKGVLHRGVASGEERLRPLAQSLTANEPLTLHSSIP